LREREFGQSSIRSFSPVDSMRLRKRFAFARTLRPQKTNERRLIATSRSSKPPVAQFRGEENRLRMPQFEEHDIRTGKIPNLNLGVHSHSLRTRAFESESKLSGFTASRSRSMPPVRGPEVSSIQSWRWRGMTTRSFRMTHSAARLRIRS
jgi:hypothetical protein